MFLWKKLIDVGENDYDDFKLLAIIGDRMIIDDNISYFIFNLHFACFPIVPKQVFRIDPNIIEQFRVTHF